MLTRRTAADRLVARVPRLIRRAMDLMTRLPNTSRLRRAVLVEAQRTGWEATNRRDWPLTLLLFHPEYEFSFRGDPIRFAPDIKPSYRGHAGVREMIETWRDGFDDFRVEPRELLDPGGSRIGARLEQVGRAGGLEVRQDIWTVWEVERGAVVRQVIFFEEAEAIEALAAPTLP